MDNLIWCLKEYGRAAGLYVPLGLIAIKIWKDRGTKILATTCLMLYGIFIFWIVSGHVAYGRHTMQGAIAMTALGVIGFSVLMQNYAISAERSRTAIVFYALTLPYLAFIAGGNYAVHTFTLPAFLVLLVWIFCVVKIISKTSTPLIKIGFWGIPAAGFLIAAALYFMHLPQVIIYTVREWTSVTILGPFFSGAILQGLAKKRNGTGITLLFCLLIAGLHIALANCATGGVEIQKAKEILNTVKTDYPGSLLLISDDPTYYFYQFYYPPEKRTNVYLCYAGGTPEQKKGYQEALEAQLGDEYLSSREELKKLNPAGIFYLGTPDWSWLGDEKDARFEPVPEMGLHKGFPVMRVFLDSEEKA